MRISRMVLAAALLAAMAPALTGCSAGPAPLTGVPPGRAVCLPASPHQKYTYALEDFTNHSGQTVVFDRVGLRDPVHLKILGAYIAVSPGHRFNGGVWLAWPPRPLPAIWAHRRPVPGHRLRPGATAQFMVGFQLTVPPGGKTPGMLIGYHTSNGSYLLRDALAVFVGRIAGARAACGGAQFHG